MVKPKGKEFRSGICFALRRRENPEEVPDMDAQ